MSSVAASDAPARAESLARWNRRLGWAVIVAFVLIALIAVAATRVPMPAIPLIGWLLAALPVLILVHHLLYLRVVKTRFVWPATTPSHEEKLSLDPDKSPAREDTRFAALMSQAYDVSAKEYQHYFSWPSLLKRYGVPILAVVVSVLGVFYVACLTPSFSGKALPATVIEGLRFGGLGAYVYLLLQLGQRGFQADVTPSFTLWCAIQVVLGALLGGVLSVIWTGTVTSSNGTVTAASASLYFLAGLALRLVVSAVQEMLRRLWLPGSTTAAQAARAVPLNQLRGITQPIEDRLNEEGIFDSYAMAMANPLKLLRNAPFDPRQVLAWIDEALLIAALPQSWQAIENEGFTGAIDLAWLTYQVGADARLEAFPAVVALASRAKIEPVLLASVIERLASDAQVIQIWSLYQDGTEGNV